MAGVAVLPAGWHLVTVGLEERARSITTNPIVVYHDECADGLTALWVCRRKWPECEAYPARYDVAPDFERLRDRMVVVVDFSWKREVMEQLADCALLCMVFDHHKSAEAELFGLQNCFFDMSRSGCGLAWDLLFPGEERPEIVNYTEDQDLWRFALPDSLEINAALGLYPLTLDMRDTLAAKLEDPLCRRWLAQSGATLLRYRDRLIADVMKRGVPMQFIGGYRVPCVSNPFRELTSDLTHSLAKGHPFACTYFDDAEHRRHFSLRSTEDSGIDVSEVARQYGGGGHRHAAGFSADLVRREPAYANRFVDIIEGKAHVY